MAPIRKLRLGLRYSITGKLSAVFVVFAAGLLAVMGGLTFAARRIELQRVTESELQSVALEKRAALESWIGERSQDIIQIANEPEIQASLQRLIATGGTDALRQGTLPSALGKAPRQAQGELHDRLQAYLSTARSFLNLFVLALDSGQVVAASDPRLEGLFREDQPYFVQGAHSSYIQNPYYSLQLNGPAMNAAAPIRDGEGRLLGVLVGQLDISQIETIVNRRLPQRATLDAYLANEGLMFVTQPRQAGDAAVLRRGINPIVGQRCLSESSAVATHTDYRDIQVISAYQWLSERRLCLIVTVDQAEVFQPLQQFAWFLVLISVTALATATLVAQRLARSFTRPVLALQAAVTRFSQGNLEGTVAADTDDEIGALTQAFGHMAQELAAQRARLHQHAIELETQVRQRTAELTSSEQRFRTLVELAPVGIFELTNTGECVLANERWTQITGLTSQQALGQNWAQTLHPDDRAQQYPLWQMSLRNGQGYGGELRWQRPDGSLAWAFAQSTPIYDSERRVSSFLGTITDITIARQAELALAEQLHYAEALARCSRALLVAGADGIDWQPVVHEALAILHKAAGCTRLGLNLLPSSERNFLKPLLNTTSKPEQNAAFADFPLDFAAFPPGLIDTICHDQTAIGHSDTLFPPHSPGRAYFADNHLRSLLLSGLYIDGVLRGYLIAGDTNPAYHWSEQIVRFLRTGLEMIGSFIQQWETGNALRIRKAQLRAVGDNLPNGFIYQLHRDRDWRPTFTYLSSGVERVLEVLPEAGLSNANLLFGSMAREDAERVEQASRQALESGSDFKEITRHLLPSGRECWLYLCSHPHLLENGEAIWDGVALDITEQQRAAQEIAQARDLAEAATRAKSVFLATMSHEMRTPLNAVLGMAALLRDTELSDEQRVFIDTIHTGGEALLAVISDILDFSRIESGRLDLEVVPFDLHTCLTSTLNLVAHDAKAKGLQVEASIAPEVPQTVLGDSVRVRQVLLNLLSNAVKFTSEGTIALQASAAPRDDGRVELTLVVSDSGLGISAEQMEQIFQPFVQADRSTARRYGGSGLGLAISRQLVELMNGSIGVVSALGVGSTFTIQLPLELASATIVAHSDAPMAPMAALSILVAEDNQLNQEVVRRMLDRMGHTVSLVNNGREAIIALEAQPYDVVLMDVQMPELDGIAATRQIRARGTAISQPYIIALTANAMSGDREQLLDAGADDYLSKPVQPNVLQQALARRGGGSTNPPAAPVAPAIEAVPLLDWETLSNMLESLDPDRQTALTTMLHLMEEALPPQLASLDASLAAHDLVRLRREAHRLRGGCLQLGAQAMAQLCQRIEYSGNDEELPALVAELQHCYEQTHQLFSWHCAARLSIWQQPGSIEQQRLASSAAQPTRL